MPQETYQVAYDQAASLLREGNLDEICAKTSARKEGSNIVVKYFSKEYVIQLPEVVFHPSDLPQKEQILILHYLTCAESKLTRGEYVSFKGLPGGGMFYDHSHQQRALTKLLKAYGDDPKKIFPVAEALGGSKSTFGDISVKFDVFPKVEIVIVLYQGDDEFPPDAGILYKDDIINYLDLEDIAIVAEEIVNRIIRN